MPSTFCTPLARATLTIAFLGFAALAFYVWILPGSKSDTATDPMADYVILDLTAIEELGISTAEAEIQLEGDTLEVPASALLSREGRQFVFVKDFVIPHTFVRVPVDTAGGGGSSAVITRGLFPGDEVVVTGVDSLASEKAAALSDEALRRYLDAPFHRTEHPMRSQKFWQRLREILPL